MLRVSQLYFNGTPIGSELMNESLDEMVKDYLDNVVDTVKAEITDKRGVVTRFEIVEKESDNGE